MPLTPDELADLAVQPAEAEVDGNRAKAHPLKDIKAVNDAATATDALANGRSGWSMLRPARFKPPGADPS